MAAGRAEVGRIDIVEGLVIRGRDGKRPVGVEVLNGVSLHGGLVCSWPGGGATAKNTVDSLLGHWRAPELPARVQFDNDPVFAGAHARPDTFGRVICVCLSLGAVPVFAPPRETGFQAAVENDNGRRQAKAWARFEHDSLASVRRRSAARVDAAPARRPFPKGWAMDLQEPLRGKVTFLRRTDVDTGAKRVRFYALRRREPTWQPLPRTPRYEPPTGPFAEWPWNAVWFSVFIRPRGGRIGA